MQIKAIWTSQIWCSSSKRTLWKGESESLTIRFVNTILEQTESGGMRFEHFIGRMGATARASDEDNLLERESVFFIRNHFVNLFFQTIRNYFE